MNTVIFIGQTLFLSIISLIALRMGVQAATAYAAVLTLLANLFVQKQIVLFGLEATASDALAIGITLTLNLMQEFYGRKAARNGLIASFLCAGVYAFLTLFHLKYQPSPSDSLNVHFIALLAAAPRIIGASLISFLISGFLDYYLFQIFKKIFRSRFLFFRNYGSIALSQAVDTLLFSFLGLYGLVSHLGQIIVVSYAIKSVALLLTSPAVWFSKKLLHYPTLKL